MRRLLKLLGLGVFLCSACSTSKPEPEHFASVEIHDRSLEDIYLATAQVFKAEGYRAVPAGPREMRFEKEGTRGQKLAHASLMSVNDGPSVVERVKAVIVNLGPGSDRLQCETFVVTDAGTAFYEDEHRVSKSKRQPYQDLLDRVAAKLK